MFKAGYVYIITNANHTALYIGVTARIEGRISEHKEHFFPKSFTAQYNLEKLVYYEFHANIEVAIEREKQLKKWNREKKEKLINSVNPEGGTCGKSWFSNSI
jgi:putative endonuclease